eukprot:gnl/Hemi2/25050_TR8427_c0_g1_i1.p2 gnl/Hemi2/25050_TR8427_c0_g1~~gnl/Hemi2/25050_TR8427_c0_g1_i1.p2  ORF type:complete len:123 (+),score=51.99 gnl/Hemi2/25050_TR8427_c0_g1_i1:42-371(+)
MQTPHHHIGVLKGSPQGGYCFEIQGREFNFSDQLMTVIGGFYGHEISMHAHFHIDGKVAQHHSLLDEHQGKTIKVTYHPTATVHPQPDWIGSFEVPECHKSTPLHHQQH